MNLYHINGEKVIHYESSSCWGAFLEEHSCPDYVNIPCKTEMSDSMLEWALSTPLLSSCVMNLEVASVREHGWVLETGGLWSGWYTAGLFCRSFTEQLSEYNTCWRYIKNNMLFVPDMPEAFKYWWYILFQQANVSPYIITGRHGFFHPSASTLNFKTMFKMPEAVINKDEVKEDIFYTKDNEVHSSLYLHSDSHRFNARLKEITGDVTKAPYTSLENSTSYACSFEEVRNAMYEIYKEVM